MPRLTRRELEARKLGMGATDLVEALGLAPWDGAGPMRVYLDKTESELADDEPSDHLEWGHWMEPTILQWYQRKVNPRVTYGHESPACNPHDAWLWATLDATAEDRIIEIKNVSSTMAWHWDTYEEGGIPRYVRAQVTIGMYCSGARLADVVACIGGRPPHVWTVAYDEELANVMLEEGREFWRNVVARKPPPLDGTPSTREYLRRTYPSNVDRVIADAGNTEVTLAEMRMDAARRETDARSDKEKLDARLMAAIGDKDGIQGPGWKMTWKVDKTGVRRQRFTAKGERG